MKAFLCLIGAVLLVDGFVPLRLRGQHTRLLATTNDDEYDVAIFGGGFGGLYTALALSKSKKKIALVDPSDSFVFLPLLYDLTVGTATEAEVCPSYIDLLVNTNIRHVKASLESLGDGTAKIKPCAPSAPSNIFFKAAVVAVGASPILDLVPGAVSFSQPFYTAKHAKQTRRLLNRLECKENRIAVVGGGFGGVELAASVQRRLPESQVVLMCRGAPLAGTRAEKLVDQALVKIGVRVEEVSVDALEGAVIANDKVVVRRSTYPAGEPVQDEEPWDAVLWTAGNRPALPEEESGLRKTDSGRLAVDLTLRCQNADSSQAKVWALGDCAEVLEGQKLPKTAQVAMQQSETIAHNILADFQGKTAAEFAYLDLGSMLTLGGPNGALLSPRDDAMLGPAFTHVLDVVRGTLDMADELVNATVGRSQLAKSLGLTPDDLGLSLGSHGLGIGNTAAPGTWAGTLTGAARRTVYAARMPTNQQRVVSIVSAALSTAAALGKEITDRK